jgi:hypothetical protein
MQTDKEKVNEWVRILKSKGVIKFDSHIAKALGYKRGSVSQILNGDKPVSYKFLTQFRKHYGEYLEDETPGNNFAEKIMELEAEVKVLKETVINLSAQINGKQASLISAELDEAIRLRKK